MAGGSATSTAAWPFTLTLTGSGWTTGAVTVALSAAGSTGAPFRTATTAGTDLRTAGGAGTIVLVTPMVVKSRQAGASSPPTGKVGALVKLTLTFSPTTTSTGHRTRASAGVSGASCIPAMARATCAKPVPSGGGCAPARTPTSRSTAAPPSASAVVAMVS